MRIMINTEDIAKATPRSCFDNPLCRALYRHTGRGCWLVKWGLLCNPVTLTTQELPADLIAWLDAFNAGQGVGPVSVNLRLALN